MWSFTKSLFTSLKRPVFLYLTSVAFTLMGLCAVLVYFVEGGSNPQISTPLDALYYTVTIMTGVGLGDISPITTSGRILSMAIMLLGTAVYVCFTGALAASILEIELSHRE